MPVGTRVIDQGTGETMGDMTEHGQRLLVAKGGWHGLGNTRFKSSVNRTPRQKTNGTPGDKRELLLELMLLADVGMLGMPNAGKSTFIRAVSAAKPKVADYPFTTLVPSLGVDEWTTKELRCCRYSSDSLKALRRRRSGYPLPEAPGTLPRPVAPHHRSD